MTPTATNLPTGVRAFRARHTHNVHAVRLNSNNIDAVQRWVEGESGSRPEWTDGRLYLVANVGLISAALGDFIVHSLFGFAVYPATEFGAHFELVDLPSPAAVRDLSVAELVPPRVADCE